MQSASAGTAYETAMTAPREGPRWRGCFPPWSEESLPAAWLGPQLRSSQHMWGLGAGAAAGPALRGQSQRVREDADFVQGRK